MTLHLGPAILIILAISSLYLGLIFHAISIDELEYRTPEATQFDPNVVIGDSPDNLVWFLQLTDLHISCRGHSDRVKDFKEFTHTYINMIKPDAVLITGDITDGIKPGVTLQTGQQLDEWTAYSGAVLEANATWVKQPAWLDIRGNHDNLNVYRPRSPKTLYRQYSIQGKHHERNYYYTLNKDGKNYTFIGVDEVQTPGLKIPFNFLGIVEDEDLTELKGFKDTAKSVGSQYTVWFAHYPTSSISSPHEGLRNIVDGPYLCGHFHTISDLVTKMHATQQPGFVEVELGDWKYNRLMRLAAIDHQLFSFLDFHFKQFPIALMTNPKPPQYMMPKFEPTGRIQNSTHIRVIAFSNSSIVSVEIQTDIDSEWKTMRRISEPLYVIEWNPKEYSHGLHQAKIRVNDSSGASQTYTQDFSIDGSKPDFSKFGRIVLRLYFRTYVMTIFFSILAVCILPTIILRLFKYRREETGVRRHYRKTFLFLLHILTSIDKLFWPLIIIPVWVAAGPHFFGYMVDEAIGACFVWGVLIDGRFVHTGITYNISSIFLLVVHIPEVVLIMYQVRSKYLSIMRPRSSRFNTYIRLAMHVMITCLQLWLGWLLFCTYGALAFVTSFMFLWCNFIYSICWYRCFRLSKADFVILSKSGNQEEHQALTDQRTQDAGSNASSSSTTNLTRKA